MTVFIHTNEFINTSCCLEYEYVTQICFDLMLVILIQFVTALASDIFLYVQWLWRDQELDGQNDVVTDLMESLQIKVRCMFFR